MSFQFTTDKERGSTPREGQQGECVCVAKANNTLTCWHHPPPAPDIFYCLSCFAAERKQLTSGPNWETKLAASRIARRKTRRRRLASPGWGASSGYATKKSAPRGTKQERPRYQPLGFTLPTPAGLSINTQGSEVRGLFCLGMLSSCGSPGLAFFCPPPPLLQNYFRYFLLVRSP